MKKKGLQLLLIFCLIFSLVGVMVACGESGGENDENTENSESEQSGGNGSGSFNYQAAAVASQLDSMRQGNGYRIKYNVDALENTEATQITVAAKGDYYYVSGGDHEYFYDASSADRMVYYEKSGAGAEWEKTTMNYSEVYTRAQAMDVMKTVIATYSAWMTYYDGFSTSMEGATKTSATVAGRSCDKYTFSAAAFAGEGLNVVSANYSCYVDKSTSICLKWEYTAVISGVTERWTMECVEFNDNPVLTLPEVSGGTTIGGDDNGNTSQGGTEQGGDNGNTQQGGDQATLQKTLPSVDEILAAIGTTFKVSAQDLSATEPTTVASDGTFDLIQKTNPIFREKFDDNYYMPYGDYRNGKYHKMGSPTYYGEDALQTPLTGGNVGNILQFAGETISYQTEEVVTFLGRSAKKYTFESDNAYGYNVLFHEEITIDDETGACLKYYGYGRAGDGFTGGTRNKNNFEVTEISYGEDDAATIAILDAEREKIDVYAWDVEFLTQVGLSDVSGPNREELFWSYWDHRSSRDSESPEWEVQYRLHCESAADRAQEVDDFIQAIYDAGANRDDNNIVTFDKLYYKDDEDNSGSFYAYTEDYLIDVETKYTSGYWRIILNISLAE